MRWSDLPIPNETITLESLWIVIWYQWYIWEGLLNRIWVDGWWKDPLDGTYYTYRINVAKTVYQLMWYLEDGIDLLSVLTPTNAANLTKRYPKLYWKTLWILIDSTTNKPLDKIKTWMIDLRSDTWSIDLYLTNTSKKSWTLQTLYWTMETLDLSQDYKDPTKCPTWFIAVPWNRDLWQPWFCVAKYEMSFAWLIQTDIAWDWNTYSYLDNWDMWVVVSQQWNSPIAEITQQEAIAECKAMWKWYHLITNSQWMTISRNIEKQWQNWSSWVKWEWYIYNWVSGDLTMWCSGSWSSLPTPAARATITWDSNCSWKNKLILSNWEEIWDLAWNISEHVNKLNTLDGVDYNLWLTSIVWSSNWEAFDDDWIYTDMNKYGSKYNYWKDKWMWNIMYANWRNNNFFMRGLSANNTSNTWIFSILLYRPLWDHIKSRDIWFRCAK